VRYFLDTHVLVWWLYDTPRLSPRATTTIADPGNTILVSAVSAFEIANKHRIGKWEEIAVLAISFDQIVEAQGFVTFSVTSRHASHAGLLPGEHRDPFDRLLAAQSRLENVPMITFDPYIQTLGVDAIW
jgi:PIN domain nuclease of toxin-antitoxin system